MASAYLFTCNLIFLEKYFGFHSWQKLMHLPVQSNPCNTNFAEPYQKKGSYGIQNLVLCCSTKSYRRLRERKSLFVSRKVMGESVTVSVTTNISVLG